MEYADSVCHQGYDLIGDVHGCNNTLCRLLAELGYRQVDGIWRHPDRQAVFVGDIVDRGPRIRESLRTVRDMVEVGAAQLVMGNHEYNLLAFLTPGIEGSGLEFLRPHTERNCRLVRETLEQFAGHADELADHVQWLMTLPLFLEFRRFRVVHACWDPRLIGEFRRRYQRNTIDTEFLQASAVYGSFANRTVDHLLRGIDLPLPDGMTMISKDGLVRRFFRAAFWQQYPDTLNDVVFQPDPLPPELAGRKLTPDDLERIPYYDPDQPALFFGHYWRSGTPALIRPNIACLDYSAVKYGKLVAYRMSNERWLKHSHFVWVDVDPDEPFTASASF